MSNVSTASIHRVGPYPGRYVGPNTPATPWTPGPTPTYPQYPTYPQQPGGYQPTYPSYPTQPQYPSYPTQPQYPGYPQYPNYPYPGQNRGLGGFMGDVWSGVKERGHEIGQMVLHPFAAYKRTPYYRPNPWVPRTSGENVGRWIVNIGLIVGAVVAGRAALGGLGGNAGAGVSGALGRVAELAAAPFRWAFRAVGAVARGASDLIGGMLSGIFGGAHVGMR